ncbi:PHP domain-containing protein [Gehongia tenuis]|uniref:PHP domain-containing protein n=1 Tax=Gehongia tenuis TaxID=2763655 RepID=A0A926D6K5_9FIRM|nr:PHP domain-containing protein [Gehongia tenuis]MBC8532329.1 PHP domain-containing protein [Gehongia tenuis]
MERLYDLHVHTATVSSCGQVEPERMAELYQRAGYDGVAVTDHYYARYFEKMGDLPWEKKVDRYLAGYRRAKTAGEKTGLQVLLGIELRFKGHVNDYLIFGVDEAFLREHPKLYELELPEFYRRFRDELFICQAHPFRDRGCEPAPAEFLHGAEVYNGNPNHLDHNYNDKARAFAKANGLVAISASDFHEEGGEAMGGTFLPGVSDGRALAHTLKESGPFKLKET